jgi:hypothetical protein
MVKNNVRRLRTRRTLDELKLEGVLQLLQNTVYSTRRAPT